jgi:Histidine kinase-, DNA gyrase B-, and HSP90-like ATPase
LQQVILNLILNAIEAMSETCEGPRELLITTEKGESDDLLVAVRDSGPGLAPGALENLFKAFHTTKPNGLGLGLSICRSIVEGHGGRLWASAQLPRGAVFQFTLPISQDVSGAHDAASRAGLQRSSVATLRQEAVALAGERQRLEHAAGATHLFSQSLLSRAHQTAGADVKRS